MIDLADPGVLGAAVVLRLRGPLDRQRLEEAVAAAGRRHEILRTTFHRPPMMELPVQIVAEEAPTVVFETTDDSEAFFDHYRQSLPSPETGPALRAVCTRLGEQDHALFLGLPALCTDATTLDLLAKEVVAHYADDSGVELVEEPLQYADFAEWHREWLGSQDAAEGVAYWRQRDLPETSGGLPGERPAEGLPLAYETRAVGTFDVDAEAAAPFFLAAWSALLARLLGAREVTVGVASDGRTYEEFLGALGPLSPTLPVAVPLLPGDRFGERMERVAAVLRHHAEWQECFSPGAVEDPGPRYGFQLLPPAAPLRAGGLECTVHRRHAVLTPQVVALTVDCRDHGTAVELRFDPRALDTAAAIRIADYLKPMIEAALEDPRQRVAEVELVRGDEFHRLVAEANATTVEAPPARPLADLLAERVREHPERPAVVFGDHTWSFAELEQRIAAVARRLHRRGIKAEAPVAVLLERHPDEIAAIFGILKSGAALLPLNPVYPPERLAFLLADAGSEVVLTHRSLADRLPASVSRILLDDEEALVSASDEADAISPASPVHADQVAYILYTSGSTGRPKGVAVSHRSVVNLLLALRRAIHTSSARRVGVNGPLAFDTSVKQWIQLLDGHTLDLLADEVGLDTEAFAAVVRQHRLDTVDCTPTQLRVWLDGGALSRQDGEVTVLIGGEAIPAALWREVAATEGLRGYNLYGPTECTVDAAVSPITVQMPTPSLGEPVANVRIYLADEALRLVPRGVVGEIVIGGAGVARGYHRRPAATAQSFVPDPFSGDAGGRLYRTGDLARRLPTGELEFLGRRDHQIKIRGFRVELGEIEAALEANPAVRAAVVTLRERVPGDRRLVAYVELRAGAQRPEIGWGAALRAALESRLPEYMVPAAYVPLERLPQTPNGKVDRRALPEPDWSRRQLEQRYIAPRTEMERALAEACAQVLGAEQVGVEDNFFELGGDSILCIQVIARVRAAGLRLTPRQFFEHQTIAALAAAAEPTDAPVADQGPVTGDVPLTPVQHWFFDQCLDDLHAWDQAVRIELRRPVSVDVLARAAVAVVHHHDLLRVRFTPSQGGGALPRQWIAEPGEAVAVGRAPLPVDGTDPVTMADGSRPNLEQGPVVTFLLLEQEGEPRALLVRSHALVIDGFSWRLLAEDLSAAVRQLEEGATEVLLPPKTTSYQQWAEDLQQRAADGRHDSETEYWWSARRTTVSPLPMIADDSDRGGAGFEVRGELSEERTRELLQDVPSAYQTRIEEVLLTALATAFAATCDGASLLVELRSHGRDGDSAQALDVSRTVGWFTTLAPVLLEVDPAQDPGSRLKQVKEQLRGLPAGGRGFGVLRYLHPDGEIRRRMAALPRPAVGFNYLGQFDATLDAGDLFRLAPETGGLRRGLWSPRYAVEFHGAILQRRFQVVARLDGGRLGNSRARSLLSAFLAQLEALIDHCRSPEAAGFTPSDFPAARLDQGELDRFLAGFTTDAVEGGDDGEAH
jgi:amino acid adenylation domain-containing protein/non-ribosomal peptide synthase protein (TIGR01720 family)